MGVNAALCVCGGGWVGWGGCDCACVCVCV